jgi:hypothetical protein
MINIDPKTLKILIDWVNWDFGFGVPEIVDAVAEAQKLLDEHEEKK